MARRPKSKVSIAPALIFFALGLFSQVGIFFIFSMFFFIRYIMASQSQKKVRNQMDRDRQEQYKRYDERDDRRRDGESRRRQRQRAPEPVPQAKYRAKSNPFKKTGIQKYKDYDMEGAIDDFKKGLDIDSRDIALHFNLAAAYSLTEKKDKGFYHLSEAVKHGFKDFEKIDTHDDLAYLRIQAEFDDFKAKGYRYAPTANNTPLKEAEVTDDVLLSQLNKLAEMRKKGLLSQGEFILEKEKLLRQ